MERETAEQMKYTDEMEADEDIFYDYELEYMGVSTTRSVGNTAWQAVASLNVFKDGAPVGTLTTEKVMYWTEERPSTNVGILASPLEDLYVIFEDAEDLSGAINNRGSQRATLEVQVNPLVGWIWWGGLILTVGSLIAIWPSRGGIPQVKTAEAQPEPATAA